MLCDYVTCVRMRERMCVVRVYVYALSALSIALISCIGGGGGGKIGIAFFSIVI